MLGSAVLLLVPHAVHFLWPSAIIVDLVIAAVIGGSHLFATYTLTFILNLDLLVTAFFFMVALHVIHQAGYVADSYRDKRPEPHGLAGFSRGIDYGLLASSLFVLATFKFTGASLRLFGLGLSQHPFTTGAALLACVLCAAAFLIKCGYEVAGHRLNVPKTLHMTLAAGLLSISPRRWRTCTFFLTPCASSRAISSALPAAVSTHRTAYAASTASARPARRYRRSRPTAPRLRHPAPLPARGSACGVPTQPRSRAVHNACAPSRPSVE